MDNASLEMALGMIVFGPIADSLEGMQFTAMKLRQAATLLEYRYAIERSRYAAHDDAQLGENTGIGQQMPVPPMQPAPKRKRQHRATRAANGTGAADHGPGLASPGSDPLFPPEAATE